VISPGTGSLAPVARNDHCRLDLSSGRPGPHDFTVRSMSFVREAKTPLRHAASTAFRSHVRDDRDTPLRRNGTGGTIMLIWRKSNLYFCLSEA
jgi:hypothetical protein